MTCRITSSFLDALRDICGASYVIADESVCWAYGGDNSCYHCPPRGVVFPRTHEQVCQIVFLGIKHKVALVARGNGTSTTGASVPVKDCVVVCFSKMNRILSLNVQRRSVRVQPGVINQQLQAFCKPHNLFWPPDPSSSSICTIGGNLACNSGGARSGKYGTPRDHTLSLRAVCGNGKSIRTGASVAKSVVGLDLTRLLIGSEGTLAIITEAELRLSPIPSQQTTYRLFFKTLDGCFSAIYAVMALDMSPSVLEFLDGNCLGILRKYPMLDVPPQAKAMLLLEVEGNAVILEEYARDLQEVVLNNNSIILFDTATTEEQVRVLWHQRKSLSPALRTLKPGKSNQDIGVPIDHLKELISGIEKIASDSGLQIATFGHAASGNFHVNILHEKEEKELAQMAVGELFALVIKLEGTISGEHGVGLAKKAAVAMELDVATLSVMHGVTSVFDPCNILNPGKALPEILPIKTSSGFIS